MKIYKLRYGFSGMEKFLTEEEFNELSLFDQTTCYEEAVIREGISIKKPDLNLDKRGSEDELQMRDILRMYPNQMRGIYDEHGFYD